MTRSTSGYTRRDMGPLAVGALGAMSGARASAATPAKPNILILIADDAGARHFGLYGNETVDTPNLDALARGGLVGDNAILTTPQCSPSRISILTGKHPHATGAEDLHEPMPAAHTTIAAYLQTAGYVTGSMRKQHFGGHAAAQFNWYDKDLEAFPSFLDAAGDRPFFLWVGFNDPHRPYEDTPIEKRHAPDDIATPPWLVDAPATRQDLARYYDEIARMDRSVGAMLAELDARGSRANTLVLFMSDNGAPFPREKGTLYDAGVRTPFIANWPGVTPAGHRHAGVISVIDIAPTVLAMAGMAKPGDMHGTSILDGLADPARLTRDHAFCQRNWHNCDEHMRGIRTGRYKLITNAYTDLPHGTAADIGSSPAFKDLLAARSSGQLTPAQQRLFEVPRPAVELYDLDADPFELDNRADDPGLADVRADLLGRLETWRQATGDFPPWRRRRADNTDRQTGVKFWPEHHLPPLFDTGS